MKKTYFAPNTTIVVLNSKQTLLTGSSAVSGLDGFGGYGGNGGDGDDADSRRGGFWDDEE